MTASPPRILSVAGSDSSGGAGIQADIKTITMLGAYAMTAITAVTAQNTTGVRAVRLMTQDDICQQMQACIEDIGVDAIKTGMLPDANAVRGVASVLRLTKPLAKNLPIVVDPVLVATSGDALADGAVIATLHKLLLPEATLITPNLPEMEALTERRIACLQDMVDAAETLRDRHRCGVLAKGGHLHTGSRVVDIYLPSKGRMVPFDDERIDSRSTHGTGCTLSSAIATLAGSGMPMEEAIRQARIFVRRAIEHAPGFGEGHGPMAHQAVRTGWAQTFEA